MKFFISQYEEEWNLLEKIKESCSDLVTHKESAKHLSLYGPGQPCKIAPASSARALLAKSQQYFNSRVLTAFAISASSTQARPQRMDNGTEQRDDEAGYRGSVLERLQATDGCV